MGQTAMASKVMIAYSANPSFANVEPTRILGINQDVEQQIKWSGNQTLDPEKLRIFTTQQTAFPIDGGRVLLRTYAPLRLVVDEIAENFEVEQWGIRLRCEQAHELAHHIVRTFLTLQAKAEGRSMSEDDKKLWLGILDQVDYQQFCIDRALPHYVEGQLISLAIGRPATVEWADQSQSTIEARIAVALSAIKPGDRFSAYAKLGRSNEILSLETVSLLAAN